MPLATPETPKWLVLARQRPVLWMAGLPVVLASLLILVLLALEPPRRARPEPSKQAASALETAAAPAPAPADAPRSDSAAKAAALASLEGKPSASLSVSELVTLSEGQAERKREGALALSRKLQQQPELLQDVATQTELMRSAADPDTARIALAAMAQSQSAIGADLLYEVWTSRSAAPTTAELARALLQSHDVRALASPALSSALVLREADSCEAVDAALTQAQNDADRRSLASLAKLNSRHQCGKKPTPDCAACARSQQKQVMSVIGKIKGRRAPTYPKG